MIKVTLLSRVAIPKACVAIAFALFCFCPNAALAGGPECMTSYYRAKSPTCVDDILALFRQAPPNSGSDPATIIGFLAYLLKDSAHERDRILKAEPSEYVKSLKLVSLYRAGLPELAEKFAAANNLLALSEKLRAAHFLALDAVRPSSSPGDNDLLIGAYMASGDTTFIRRILENYSSADDGMVGDAFRIGFMTSKFGTSLAPKGRENVTLQVACAKYECKADQTKLFRVMTLATAIWSLQSLANQDKGIEKTLTDFLARDARVKTLFAAEQTAFSNYLAAIVVVTTLKDDHTGAEREQAYAAMGKSASIYENLGSPAEAFAPISHLNK